MNSIQSTGCQTHKYLEMLSANTYPPVPETTGLLDTAFHSEAAYWPEAHITEKASCRPEVALSSRHWLWQQLGKSALAACVTVMLSLSHVNQDALAALHFIPEENMAHV